MPLEIYLHVKCYEGDLCARYTSHTSQGRGNSPTQNTTCCVEAATAQTAFQYFSILNCAPSPSVTSDFIYYSNYVFFLFQSLPANLSLAELGTLDEDDEISK